MISGPETPLELRECFWWGKLVAGFILTPHQFFNSSKVKGFHN